MMRPWWVSAFGLNPPYELNPSPSPIIIFDSRFFDGHAKMV
jgi:hypothetical protein